MSFGQKMSIGKFRPVLANMLLTLSIPSLWLKIAVKMSIMRVVKFMSSWDNDFMSWPKHHQLLFGGQSVELPLSLHWFLWLPPGGYQGLSMWEIWGKNSQSFDVWRTLTSTDVKGYRNRVTCRSQVMRPQSPLMPYTPQMLSSKYCQR